MKKKIRKIVIVGVTISMLCISTAFAEDKPTSGKNSLIEYKDYSISTLLLEDFHKEISKTEEASKGGPLLSKDNPQIPRNSRIENIQKNNRGTFVNKDFKSLYIAGTPMPVEHQKYLYDLCITRNLDYVKTLALLKHESQFKVNIISGTNDYGYMQINKGNHNNLSKTLGTANDGLNPYVNMNWGTHMLSNLYDSYISQGLTGDKLDRSVWSAYNKGVGGFNKYGEATAYIGKVKNEIKWINEKLGL